jgi:hypothetical protein
VQDAQLDDFDERLFTAAGLSRPAGEPLVHYARGVTVNIRWPRPQRG